MWTQTSKKIRKNSKYFGRLPWVLPAHENCISTQGSVPAQFRSVNSPCGVGLVWHRRSSHGSFSIEKGLGLHIEMRKPAQNAACLAEASAAEPEAGRDITAMVPPPPAIASLFASTTIRYDLRKRKLPVLLEYFPGTLPCDTRNPPARPRMARELGWGRPSTPTGG